MKEHDPFVERLWAFVRGDTVVSDFEQWVYAEPSLEERLGGELYLATISTSYSDDEAVFSIREALARFARARSTHACVCIRLRDQCVVDMGAFGAPAPAFESDRDWTHEDVLASFDEVRSHGGERWWLWAARCRECGQGWLVGSEERHNDLYCMRRLSRAELEGIVQDGTWPDDFDEYERMLEIGRDAGRSVRFVNPLESSLSTTVGDLAKRRPGITVGELASLLSLDIELAAELARRAVERDGVEVTFEGE